MHRVLFVFGTRPEAVKLCPLIRHLRERSNEFTVRVCVTAQHRHLLDQVLTAFGVTPDDDLNVMAPGQSLLQATSRILAQLESVIESARPDLLIVQGDTTTTLCGALAGFYGRVPVGHVEAGLRTGDPAQPFPEEMNRVLTGRLTTLHFAATQDAANNLFREGVPERNVVVTGNTGIDAVLHVRALLETGTLPGYDEPLLPGHRLVLVTAHRRESFGAGMERICDALATIAQRPDVEVIFPVHPNPAVRETVQARLVGVPHVRLLEPLDYVPFVDLMRRADVLLTDSGGIQEEGPSLGKPVLVMRDRTERPEGVAAGAAQLVGTDVNKIVEAVTNLLHRLNRGDQIASVHHVYGDGRASERIADAIVRSGAANQAAR